ncbi:multicopper oxidase family protein [Vulgatibacter incomptus]|uniref:Multicopper oxidase n=1 Tax=Vulgatibacter incomptus TaxID=1391653 RepID=A0A0K1PEN8_9BACT|nr:multicopper oxidase family protein [Vulgatibacter incomptus]AKU91980.1 Multicopper oxidase [Vulgatibacter incomptus]
MRFLALLLAPLAILPACKDSEGRAVERLAAEASPFLERKPASTGRIRELDLVAAPTNLALLDGRSLDVWAYNGQLPGPTIRVMVGDTLRVRFLNRLPQPSTIHWHGIRLPNGMDGVPGVTQPPIPPGGSFVYEFVARDPGTFWYHPHIRGSEQLERGLYGMLIVEEAEAPPEREILWVLDDWRLDETGQIDPRFVTRGDLAHDGRWGTVITVNGDVAPDLVLGEGERVRLRILNAANGRVFRPDFGAFDARVIAFDGLATARPLPADDLVLAPGNRVDLDLVASSRQGDRIRVMDRFTRRENHLATIRVGPSLAPIVVRRPNPGFVPTWSGAEAIAPDVTFRLNAKLGGPFGVQWMINDHPMHHDDQSPISEWHEPPYRLRRGKWTKLRFVNESARLHPMHLHGQFFKVVARDGRPVDEEHWRDTVLVGPRETVDVGLVPTEPGSWMLHCHIMEHQDAGMMTLIAVDG